MGVGAGLIIASIVLAGVNKVKPMTKVQIEEKAMEYGMDYPDDMKVINKKDVSK